MSLLRDIMQRLAANRSDAAAPVPPAAVASELASYRSRLRTCSKPMLDYEWTWLHQSLDDLELCRNDAPMEEAAGGSQRVQQLLDQARTCLRAIQEECEERRLTPVRQPLSVAVGEHAWEVSNAAIRSSWKLDGQGAGEAPQAHP